MTKKRRSSCVACAAILAVTLSAWSSARAAPPPPSPPASPPPISSAPGLPAPTADAGTTDERTLRGREAYLLGVKRSKDSQWGEALAAFEEAMAARDAPVVQFNIGYCQRALGRYVAALRTLRRVLAQPGDLAPTQLEDARSYVAELEQSVVRVTVTLDPAPEKLTVDGRSLQPTNDEGSGVFVVAAGDGSPPPSKVFNVLLDPGAHIFRATRHGHKDAFLPVTYRPNDKANLDLHLDALPALTAIRSEPNQASILVNDRDMGITPKELELAPGRHRIQVLREGFEPYISTITLESGERAESTAKLVPVRPSVLRDWRLWTGVGIGLAAVGTGVYFAVRGPPDYDGGNLNWVAHPTSIHW